MDPYGRRRKPAFSRCALTSNEWAVVYVCSHIMRINEINKNNVTFFVSTCVKCVFPLIVCVPVCSYVNSAYAHAYICTERPEDNLR